jgi:hypothetical protein
VPSIEIFEIVKKANILMPSKKKIVTTIDSKLILANLKIINIS